MATIEDFFPDPLTLVKHAADALTIAKEEGADDPTKFLKHELVTDKGATNVAYKDLVRAYQARLYAAAGFHVSVTMGLARSGNGRQLWGRAARAYFRAWDSARAQMAAAPLNPAIAMSSATKGLIDTANAAAEVARIGGGKTSTSEKPPDPTAPPEAPPVTTTSTDDGKKPGGGVGTTALYVGAGLLGAIGLAAFFRKKGKRGAAHAADAGGYSEEDLEEIAADLAEQATEFE